MSRPFLFQSLTWEDVKELNTEETVILIPVGSIEQHGPQNPLGTDYLIADNLAQKAAASSPLAYCLPPIPVGVSSHHREFPGTLWLSPATLRAVITDVFHSLLYHKFRKIIVVNGHGGNTAAIMEVINDFNDHHNTIALLFEWWKDTALLESTIGTSQVIHADAVETSVIWAAQPSYVKPEKFKGLTSAPQWGRSIGELFLASRTDQFSSSGIAGSLDGISQEKGQKIIDAAVEKLVKAIEDLSNYKD
ncbi:MAG: creatininase family protein [Candidatus Heimdallarchaeaceae archaeon]